MALTEEDKLWISQLLDHLVTGLEEHLEDIERKDAFWVDILHRVQVLEKKMEGKGGA